MVVKLAKRLVSEFPKHVTWKQSRSTFVDTKISTKQTEVKTSEEEEEEEK